MNVICATKNMVGMINRSRRITYLSTAHCSKRVYSAMLLKLCRRNRRDRLAPVPPCDSSRARPSALLRHVDIGEAGLLEPQRGEVEVLHVWLDESRGCVGVDSCGGRGLWGETRGLVGKDGDPLSGRGFCP